MQRAKICPRRGRGSYAAVSEHLGSLKLAKSYGAEGRHAQVFAQLSHELGEVGRTNVRSAARLKQQLAIGSAALLAAIVYVLYTLLAVPTAQLLLLLFLFARLVPRLTTVYERARALATTLPAFAAVVAMEEHCLAAAAPAVGRAQAIDLTERIAFEHVTFDYREDGRSPAVRDVTFTLDAGATTAIVGPSGSGKSTLADLLMGLLTPSEGRILVDGAPLDAGHLDAWRDQIGYVAQEAFSLPPRACARTCCGRSPTPPKRRFWHALRLASADAFVRALPHGLDTVVGTAASSSRAASVQRLSLARALVRRPALLILDEATSSLDSENEARIQQAIDQLHQQMTIVVITHRLSTIRGADTIHVVDSRPARRVRHVDGSGRAPHGPVPRAVRGARHRRARRRTRAAPHPRRADLRL